MMDKDILVISVYGPNRDDPDCYEQLQERVNDLGLENITGEGYWNLVLNISLN